MDKKTKIYQLALVDGLRSPFEPPDETTPADKPEAQAKKDKKDLSKPKPAEVKIDRAQIVARLQAVPAPAGNYRSLRANDKALFWIQSSIDGEVEGKKKLVALPIGSDHPEVKTLAQVESYELSQDGKKLLLRQKDSLVIADALPAPADPSKNAVKLSGWSLSLTPREEWRQMFTEAWRLERDYFYDRGLHGIDWKAMHKKYEPLVERVHSRTELSDLLAQMVAELSALHIFVFGGDMREGSDKIGVASLGAVLEPDLATSALRIGHIYQHDPDEPELAGPLSRPGVNLKAGDLIYRINGQEVRHPSDVGRLLRNKAGHQALLEVRHKPEAQAKEVIVKPISLAAEANLRYHEWETSRRLKVEELGKGDIGYLHLRAMGGGNFTEFAKGFYPVFTRQGLIIDVRHNRGGNIDSWILARLLRKAWFHWNQRVGQATQWNMQYAFRGHIVVMCNEYTASDGEAFCEGIKRLGLGKVIGTRTWGGEIWLTSSNFLVDKGIATAAEFGVYGPEGAWLIEGHGVEPDIVVDNLPHATFQGQDAQLEAAIRYLQKQIKEKPIVVPPVPAFPNKSFPLKKASGLWLPSPFGMPASRISKTGSRLPILSLGSSSLSPPRTGHPQGKKPMKVLIADKFPEGARAALARTGVEVVYDPDLNDAALTAAVGATAADILVVRGTKVPAATLVGGRLSLVVRAGAGCDTIDVPAASARGIYVANCPGKNSVAVAELTFALILALDRRIPANAWDLKAGRWNKAEYSKARGLFGRTLGLVGLGRIGQEVLVRARAFGMPVVAWSPSLTPERAAPLGVQPKASPTEVAAACDVLSIHVALNSDTRNLIHRGVLDALRPGSYFINTARAEVVDQAALYEAVRDRGIRSGLDVFAGEPSGGAGTVEERIFELDGVIGTHHIGASTDQAQQAIADEAIRIIREYVQTGRVPNVINLAKKSPATHLLVVHHYDRVGVLSAVFSQLKHAGINVQETENIVFEGATAAVARIHLDGAPPPRALDAMRAESPDIMELSVLKL